MNPELLLAYILAVVIIVAVPGPNIIIDNKRQRQAWIQEKRIDHFRRHGGNVAFIFNFLIGPDRLAFDVFLYVRNNKMGWRVLPDISRCIANSFILESGASRRRP